MKRLISIVACFILSLGVLAGLAGCTSDDTVKLGTGNEEGMYYRFGTMLAEASAQDDTCPTLSVESTAGSSANLRLLSQGFLDVATVQADTLYDAANGTGLFVNSGAYEGFSAVAGLYTEACQIIVAADSPLTSVEDLAGKTVSVGERESGVLQNALQILDAYNLQEGDFTAEYLSFSESANALADGTIDAAFITAAAPTPAVTNLADTIGVRVLSLDQEVIDSLVAHHSYYTPCTVEANTYAGQTEAAKTVGVRAVLVARNDMPADQVQALAALTLENGEAFGSVLGEHLQPTLEEATLGIPVSFHPGAAAYFADNGIDVSSVTNGGSGSAVTASQDD